MQPMRRQSLRSLRGNKSYGTEEATRRTQPRSRQELRNWGREGGEEGDGMREKRRSRKSEEVVSGEGAEVASGKEVASRKERWVNLWMGILRCASLKIEGFEGVLGLRIYGLGRGFGIEKMCLFAWHALVVVVVVVVLCLHGMQI